jgi:predicted GNAT family acetyltransferase
MHESESQEGFFVWCKIDEIPLKTGEIMEIRMVKAPDDCHRHGIASFLPRYSEIWLWHLNLALRGELNGLESRFYLGLLKGKIISNASTWEHGSIGIIGHLFTAENHRRKGACAALMKTQIQDFRNRGGKALIGGFKQSSYPIAKSLGFRSIVNNCEAMRHDLDRNFGKTYFSATNASCRDSLWMDWPGVSLLYTVKQGWCLRSMRHKIFGPYDYEDYFLEDMRERSRRLCISKVLLSEKGNIVGHAALTFKHHPKGTFWLLDFFIHPTSVSYMDTMLDAVRFPKGKIKCYVESDCYEKRHALLRWGFQEAKYPKKEIKLDGKNLELVAMGRLEK